jgi:hypothetical protein
VPAAGGDRKFFFDGGLHKDGAFNEGWSQSLKDAGYERLANKGALVKSEGDFLRSLDDALGLVGKKSAGFPTATSTETEIAEYRRSAGVPDAANGYTLKPESLPEGVVWDEAGASEFAGLLHKHHAPAALATELGAMWAKQQGQFRETAATGFEQQVNDLAAKSAQIFGKEWGDEMDDRRQANADFAKVRGLDLNDPVLRIALSHPDIVRLLDEARRSVREAPLPGVNEGVFTGSGSPRQQAMELMRANPRWQQDPVLSKRIQDLHAMNAKQEQRKR